MAQAYKFDDSDSADDLGIINVPKPRAHREPCLPSDHHRPLVPPPPTAAVGVKRMKSSTASRGFRPKPEPLASLPPVPPVPVLATTTGSIPGTPKMPDTPARSRSRRKTLLERIDGWWDLGLLDKRQTLSRGQSKGVTEQKL